MLEEPQWEAILRLGNRVENSLQTNQVGLTMGGEPTYIAIDRQHLPEWYTLALGNHKRQVAVELLQKLAERLAPPGSLLQYGMGKLYPGEPYPRWAFGCFWRSDGLPLWRNPALAASENQRYGHRPSQAKAFLEALVEQLGLSEDSIVAAWEWDESTLAGFVLPLLAVDATDAYSQASSKGWHWASCVWTREGKPYGTEQPFVLVKGETPIGMRLPLGNIDRPEELAWEIDAPLSELAEWTKGSAQQMPPNTIRVSLSVEIRDEMVSAFVPPFASSCAFADLVSAIEQTAVQLDCPVRLEGYGPPPNSGIEGFAIVPDPGVIEVNIYPVADWDTLVHQTLTLHAIAEDCGLGATKYARDGRRLGTGGGAHITLGAKTPADSPLLRRPDLLQSIITYWQHHPSLSYLFAGQFVGPTSQAPRVDEARHDGLYELEVAFKAFEKSGMPSPELIDRLLRPLLVDTTGNTHRAALCIDKLFPVDIPQMQLGILEFRAFEMPHSPQLRLLQLLLVRALVAWFWEQPYRQPMIHWGATLHDRFFLPHFLAEDLASVLDDLKSADYEFDLAWFEPFFQTRFPIYGRVSLQAQPGLTLELRHALEMWPVLPEKATLGGTSRPVDDSMERIQVLLRGNEPERYRVLCQGRAVPLEISPPSVLAVGGVRFRAKPLAGLGDAAIAPHTALTFEVIDTQAGRSMGGCAYRAQPADGAYEAPPQTDREAENRLRSRVVPLSPRAGCVEIPPPHVHSQSPLTLDLRWAAIDPFS
ncbi:transglutaminase family protein [Altericista sp. CCNU0014]|uniref:transglutaminase family protein n=1 Tax=Altericista sp. CCNU0014 TaxID=3082949 RepID=UPI0038502FA5